MGSNNSVNINGHGNHISSFSRARRAGSTSTCVSYSDSVKEFEVGDLVEVTLFVPERGRGLNIGFLAGIDKREDDIALLISADFFTKQLNFYARKGQRWDTLQTSEKFPFEQGGKGVIQIKYMGSHNQVSVNGQEIANLKHRVDPNSVQTIFVESDVRVERIDYRPFKERQ
ncbi:32 kDa beta-galactoside-binding lectin-like [Acanthaster planci]|uniref:Galectin n=1 Tax=Acanthaster planci TaxID=133434 RepID=A0A8B7ZDB6_ACAPL|nr:32 kDa beta-galactoside-binding lectin-like [Acanthaster planci]